MERFISKEQGGKVIIECLYRKGLINRITYEAALVRIKNDISNKNKK